MSEGIAIAIIAFLVVLTIGAGLTSWFIFLSRTLLFSQSRQNFEKLSSLIENLSESQKSQNSILEEQLSELGLSLKDNHSLNAKLASTSDQNFDLLKNSEILVRKQAEYKMFFSLIFETLTEDTKFIRSEFFRRFANIPEYEEINSKIIAFENKIEQTRLLLKEQNMMENCDE